MKTKHLFLLPVLLFCFSCNESGPQKAGKKEDRVGLFENGLFNQDEFAKALQAKVPALDTTDSVYLKTKILSVQQALRYAYTRNEFSPFWVKEKGVTDAAGKLIDELAQLGDDGLDPEKYHVSDLRKQLDALKGQKSAELSAVVNFDTTCTRAYLQASRDLLIGSVPLKKADSLWYHVNDSVWSAPKLMLSKLGESDDYPGLKEFRSEIPTYALLQQTLHRYRELSKDSAYMAVKENMGTVPKDSVVAFIAEKEIGDTYDPGNDTVSRSRQILQNYQYYNGLRMTGKKDSITVAVLSRQPDETIKMIEANMERLRWLPKKLEDEYVLVNIPMMEFMLRKDNFDAFRMRVVVGKPERQTPVLNARMVNIVFNPSWGVPPTILKKDVLPGLTKSGAAYLSKKGLRAYDHNGNAVDAGSITEANYKRFIYKQPPGDDNSLGVIKFNLPNQWDIYLHDTPHKEDFPNYSRAKSSGCIRLQKPRELAEYILTELEGRNRFGQPYIDTLVQTHKTRYEILKNKIPVHIVYLTAFEDSTGKQIRFLRDVYGRDAKLLSLMQ
ncbi:L,D-transpeptidase family protein [Taibaiella soli]|uniref:L,D-transpeptidase family protein n=1 Tax=Taibaiella soli TaxID=1649169 RepID=UPI001402B1D2|nr:L,D-transpeptidase family protein [Taibaiella soli]